MFELISAERQKPQYTMDTLQQLWIMTVCAQLYWGTIFEDASYELIIHAILSIILWNPSIVQKFALKIWQ